MIYSRNFNFKIVHLEKFHNPFYLLLIYLLSLLTIVMWTVDIAQFINKLEYNRRFISELSVYRLFDCYIPSRFTYQLVQQVSIRFYLKWGHVGRELATFNRTSSSLSLFLFPSLTPFSVSVAFSLPSLHLSLV